MWKASAWTHWLIVSTSIVVDTNGTHHEKDSFDDFQVVGLVQDFWKNREGILEVFLAGILSFCKGR